MTHTVPPAAAIPPDAAAPLAPSPAPAAAIAAAIVVADMPPRLSETIAGMANAVARGEDEIDTLIRSAERRGLVPVMTFAALVVVSPLSSVPFVSSLSGLIIAISAIQTLLGRSRLWLPKSLRARRVAPHRLRPALNRVGRVARWIEDRASPRLAFLSAPPFSGVFLGLAAFYGLMMPFMELVPMTASIAGLAVALTGIGLMLRDGVFLLASLLPPAVATAVVVFFTGIATG